MTTFRMTSDSEVTRGSCLGQWNEPHHMLFQLAHTALLLSFLAPNNKYGLLFLHAMLIAGFLLLCSWAWAVVCSPDIFSWNFSFLLINVIQVLFILYRLRPIRLSAELEDIFQEFFQPLKVSRSLFKKLIADDWCRVCTLQQGELYATQDVTKMDCLSLMISGTAHVSCNGQFLHLVQSKQFLDSSEFESTLHGDDTFKCRVDNRKLIYGDTQLCIKDLLKDPTQVLPWRGWNRQLLETLFSKEQFLMTVMLHIIGRDITNKLYQFTDKVRPQRLDIRLPNFSNTDFCGVDVKSITTDVTHEEHENIFNMQPTLPQNNICSSGSLFKLPAINSQNENNFLQTK